MVERSEILRQEFENFVFFFFTFSENKMDNYWVILDCYETSQVQIKISSLIFNSQKQLVIKSMADPRSSPKSDPAGAFSKPAFQISKFRFAKIAFLHRTKKQKQLSGQILCIWKELKRYSVLIPVRRKSIVCQRKFTSWSYFLDEPDIDSISIFTRNSKFEM